jgi:ubiquinone/menaquinone biosynthesis C-methylase UbiE
MSQKHYVLQSGDAGAERLRVLEAVKWPSTQTLLDRLDFKAGMRCLDAGCGLGAVTTELARRVGDSGLAVGIDIDARCLALAETEASKKVSNIRFRTESVNEIGDQDTYDLVYARFLLTHLPDPARGLARMLRAARPGGRVVVEDIEFSGHFSHPACPAFTRYIEVYQQVVKSRGADPEIGPRLVGLFLDAGMDDVGFELVQPVFRNGPGKHLARMTLQHICTAVVGAGIATEAEIHQICQELDDFAQNDRSLISLPRIFQVWGRKRQ